MAWQGILGHDRIADQLRTAVARGRLASTFLFVGPNGVGKSTFAIRFAQALLCETNPERDLAPCGSCPACQQVTAMTHPDLEYVVKPKEKSFIPIELFIGDRDHRSREGLCHIMALKPFRGGRKIAIVDDADFLNQEGANCLLKTLEEPPPKSVIMLIASSEQKQLPTVRSRCQIIRFQPLEQKLVAKVLFEKELVSDQQEADDLAALADGSISQALSFANPSIREFRVQLMEQLTSIDSRRPAFMKSLTSIVDEAGKDAPARRARMRFVMQTATGFYTQLMRIRCGAPATGDSDMRRAVEKAQSLWPGEADTAAKCVQRCMDAETHVLSNANQATVLECWIDDLAELTRSGF